MKQFLTRAGAVLVSLVCTVQLAAAAAPLRESSLQLAETLQLGTAYVRVSEPVQEKTLVYTPGGEIRPMVVYGDTLYGRSTMDTMQQYLSRQGYTAVGAVNAAFFDMANGLPMGMVVTDGILRANGPGRVVGVQPDGTVKIGEPILEVRGLWGEDDILLHYNQLLVKQNGIVLYSRDYDNHTKSKVKGYHVILAAEEDRLTLDSRVEARVVDIVENTKSCAIPQGGFVLSLAEDNESERFQKAIRSLKVGDSVTITTAIDRGWEDMEYIVGAGDQLVEQGRALTEFEHDSADRQAARTAIGLRADGQVLVYGVDRSSTSAGLTLPELAERMAELGCITAVNLDGGGSTTVGVTRPGEMRFTTVNEPADGEQRPCANFLFFVRPTTPAGPAVRLHIYPYEAAMLPGGQLSLEVRASDAAYMAAKVPETVTLTASNGTVKDGVFVPATPGGTVVTARSGGLTGTMEINVIETPTALELLRQNPERPVRELLLETGAALDLSAKATYEGLDLLAEDRSFRWELTDGVGTVDADGLVTAGEQEAAGTLLVSCGDLTVELSVEVRENPMTDLEGHWAREYISDLYFRGILNGGENSKGALVYRPDDSMTRQEFTAAMIRWLGIDTAQYADTELPFLDSDQIAPWAVDAMKAAYSLGYVNGSGSGKKLYAAPRDTITREAAMTMLARTQKALSASDALGDFSDGDMVSDWADEALTAMVERGVINGIDGRLQPQGCVTRAQVAKMLFFMD